MLIAFDIFFIVFKRQPPVLTPFLFRNSGFLSRVVRDSEITVDRASRFLGNLLSADRSTSNQSKHFHLEQIQHFPDVISARPLNLSQ